MKNPLAKLENRQIYIFGLGLEGFSTYNYLRKIFPEKKLILIDDKPPQDLDQHWQQAASNPYTTITTADTFLDTITNYEIGSGVMFKTPGIPITHPLIKKAEQKNLDFNSNTNLFLQIVREHQTIIGVTGTKGKSTTSALINHVLAKAGCKTVLAGNIGQAPLDLLHQEIRADYYVLELSSHQLLNLRSSPHFAVILNITPEHLDYYPDFASYTAAKARIVQFQHKDDFVVYNPLFELPRQIADNSKAKKLPFGKKTANQADHPDPLAYIQDNAIYYQQEKIADISELPLKGEHNLLNSLPAVVIAKQLGAETAAIRAGLQSFQPLAHRLEEVAEVKGVTFVNDSLSTTPEAAIAAINSYEGRPMALIAGGHERQQDFSALAHTIDESDVRMLLYFNPTGSRLANEIKNPNLIKEEVLSMEEAVAAASQFARNGWVVLLSPASASFGTFKNYEDRGNQFTAAVRALVKK